jgi:outer membrane protein assembly factor BamB
MRSEETDMHCYFTVIRFILLGICITFLNAERNAFGVETVWTFKCPAGHTAGSPAIGDVNGDGKRDIVITTTGGQVFALDADKNLLWTHIVTGAITIPPTLVNIIPDPAPEVLVLSEFGEIQCLDGATGNLVWNRFLPGNISWGHTALVASDVNGDGMIEIITGDNRSTLVCLKNNGEDLWTYRGSYGETLCPAVADINGDGLQEILIGGTKTPLVCISHDGKKLWEIEQKERGSSPVIWDLDGDGQPEILVGIDTKLTAVSAKGKILWQYQMWKGAEKSFKFAGIDSAISVGDADGDGVAEIYAADLTGRIVSLTPDGQLNWSYPVQQRVRRSPSIADIDGDGVIEILVAGYSGAIHVLTPDGKLKERIPLASEANCTATIYQPGKDDKPYVICPIENGSMPLFRWPNAKSDAAILWPEYRLNSERTAAKPNGGMKSTATITKIDYGNGYVGANQFKIFINNDNKQDLSIILEITKDQQKTSKVVASSSKGMIECNLPYIITGRNPQNLSFTCTVKAEDKVVAQSIHQVNVKPFMKEFDQSEKNLDTLSTLIPQLHDPSGYEEQDCFLQSKFLSCSNRLPYTFSMSDKKLAQLRTDLQTVRQESHDLLALVQAAIDTAAFAQGSVVVCAANPWAPFGGMKEALEGRTPTAELSVEAFAGEFESAALNIFNFGAKHRTFRVMPGAIQTADGASSVAAKQVITLHEALEVPTQILQTSSVDALPTLNQANTILVPARAARQLWLSVDTSKLKPGDWSSKIQLRSLDAASVELTASLNIKVWKTALPQEQPLRLCHWGHVHSSLLRDQPEAALQDQVAHGTNVFVGVHHPQASYDENGDIVGEINFTQHDDYVRRYAPHGIILFCGYQGGLKGPGSHDSAVYKKANTTWMRAWVKHLAELGVGYDDFALYPVDEIGLYPERFGIYVKYAKLVREADAKIQLYTDPVDGNTLEQLKSIENYVDIWCPKESSFLPHKDTEQLDFIKSTGRTIWTYECFDHGKHLSPLGYYRGQAWHAWSNGMTGIGFWSYCTSPYDPWFATRDAHEYLLIYPGKGVVASKRWKSIRDGVEDYSMLGALKKAAQKAESTGGKTQTVNAVRELLEKDALTIGQFSWFGKLREDHSLADMRAVADKRWETYQVTRRKMAQLFEQLAERN